MPKEIYRLIVSEPRIKINLSLGGTFMCIAVNVGNRYEFIWSPKGSC